MTTAGIDTAGVDSSCLRRATLLMGSSDLRVKAICCDNTRPGRAGAMTGKRGHRFVTRSPFYGIPHTAR